MKKMLRTLAAGLFISTVMVLSWHAHAEHDRDIHKNHSSCGVCSNFAQLAQKILPQSHRMGMAPEPYAFAASALPVPQSSQNSFSLHFSRAPPL